jgi:hypothetical protein
MSSSPTLRTWAPSASDDTHDRIDAQASLIANQAVSGTVTPEAARWEIAALVTMSDIPTDVANRFCNSTQYQEKVDIGQYLAELLETKIVGPNPSLDLAIVAGGGSVSGWARMLASSQPAITSARRSVHNRTFRQIPTDPHSYQHPDAIADLDGSEYVGADSWGEDAIDEDMSSEVWDALAASYTEKSHNMRPNGAVHQIAETLCGIYQLPTPARAINLTNRKQMIANVESDQFAVRDDLRASAATQWSEHIGLAAVFADWTIEDLNRLAIQHPLVSQALAISALTPLPPARRAEVKALGESLADQLGKLTANRVAKAWAEVHAELTGSEYDNTRPAPKMKTKAQRNSARRAWESEVSALVGKGITLLGTTPEEVTRSLGKALDAIRHDGDSQAA